MTAKREKLKYLTPNTSAETLERFKRSFCIPNDAEWLGVFMGAILPLTDASNWEQHGSVTPEQAAEVFMQIFNDAFYETNECEDDMSCCPMRYGANGRIQQQNPDTGIWTDIENPPLPTRTPIEGQDTECLAAANAAEVMKQLWDAWASIWETGTILVVATALLSIIATIIFYPPALPLVLTFFVELYGLMATIGADDFDSDKQNMLKCTLFCHAFTEDDITTFDFDQVVAWVDEQWTPVTDINVWTGIHYLLLIIGEDGLNRAGATTSITEADCTDCTECEWCYTFDFALSDGGFTALNLGGGNWGTYTGTVWQDAFVSGVGDALAIQKGWTDAFITRMRVKWLQDGNPADNSFAFVFRNNGSNVATGSLQPTANGEREETFDIDATADYVLINPALGNQASGNMNIQRVTLWGTGDNPFGSDNC